MFEERLEAPVGTERAEEEAGEAGKEEEALPKKDISDTKLAAEPVSVSVRVGGVRKADDEMIKGGVIVAEEVSEVEAEPINAEPM